MKQTTQYKNTAIEPIPTDWVVRKLGEVSEIKTGKKDNQNKTENGIYPFFVRSKNIEKINSYSFDGEAILVPGEGNIGEIFHYINGKFDYHQRVYKISNFNEEALGKFVYYYFQVYFLRETIRHSVKATVDSLRLPTFTNMEIHLPPLPEQQKIADILSTWDKAIQETNVIIEKLKKRNKALANKLLMDNDKKPNQKQMLKIVDRIKNSFTPEENTLYKQIGIRSHSKGLFYKEAVTGKSLGNKSVFWIEPNCFIVNIVFAWEQAIGKTTDADIGFIASHRFPMYRPKEGILNLDYLLYFFKSLKGKYLLELASPGGAGRNKTLGQTEFLKLKIPVPSMEEQIKLVNILDTATEELQQYQQKLSNLKLQKKGLMQQLLTGKTRII